jgi:hypothetical protein
LSAKARGKKRQNEREKVPKRAARNSQLFSRGSATTIVAF